MNKIIITLTLLLIGCAQTEQRPATMIDMDMLYNEIKVTHRILIPGTDQYCEVDKDNYKITSCVTADFYADSEE